MGYSLSLPDLPPEEDNVPGWEFFAGDKNIEEYNFSIVTSNAKEVYDSIRNRVWVIEGQKDTKPRGYHLYGFFYPLLAEKTLVRVGRKEFKYRLIGYDDYIVGHVKDACHLPKNGIFGDLLYKHKNFKTGFREIEDPEVVGYFEEVYENTLKGNLKQ